MEFIGLKTSLKDFLKRCSKDTVTATYEGQVYVRNSVTQEFEFSQEKTDERRESDEALSKRMAKEQEHKQELIWAARSRLLTVDEVEELKKYGPFIFVRDCVSYNEEKLEKRFNDLLLQQFNFRILAEKHEGEE